MEICDRVIAVLCSHCGRQLNKSEIFIPDSIRAYFCINYGNCPNWSENLLLPVDEHGRLKQEQKAL